MLMNRVFCIFGKYIFTKYLYAMKKTLLLLLITVCSCHSITSKKGQENDSIFECDTLLQQQVVSLEESKQSPPLSNPTLQPVARNIPTGEAIDPDSLSMKTEYDYYPLSATKIKVIITNHSHYEYECGERYSLVYYNEKQKSWKELPTNPIINSILWIFPPQHPTHEQTISLYTSEVPNRPGKYRIYKSFNRDTKVAYAEFELLSEEGAEKMINIVNQYCDKYKNKEDAIAQNLSTWGLRGDTLDMTWNVNSPYMRKLFKERVLSYSATVINNGKETTPRIFDKTAYTDTLNVTMKTKQPIYPAGTKLVTVILTNNNEKQLSIGTDYYVVRKEKDNWIFLHGDRIWNLLEIMIAQNNSYTFRAALYPLLNNILPGTYRVIKHVDFANSTEKWTMAAEFRIE